MLDLSVFSTSDFQSLNLQQRLAFHGVMQGWNVLIIGGGGVGKSFLINKLTRHIPGLVVLGPTGTAAINVGGQTVDSFFGFGRHFLKPEEGRVIHPALLETLKRTTRILIDEFGSLRRDKLQLIDIRLRAAKGNNLPFGGVQIIGSGDFCQIKPVLPEKTPEFGLFKKHYGVMDVYPFFADGFNEYGFKPYLLSEYIRQDDPLEQHILKHIRLALDIPGALDRLHLRLSERPVDNAVVLCCLKRIAQGHNQRAYAKVNGREKAYLSDQEGEIDFEPAQPYIGLKDSVRVVITVNDPASGYYNGDIGTVVSMDDGGVHVQLDRGKDVYVTPYTWDFLQQSTDAEGNVSRRRKGGFTQLPLLMAYGITIHRSQGMTLPSAHIDLTGGFFAEGMPYVALSRVGKFANLSLSRRLSVKDIKYSKEAIEITKTLSMLALKRQAEDVSMLSAASSLAIPLSA